MKRLFISLLLLCGISLTSFAQTINSESSVVKFEISNFKVNTVEGTFSEMKGEVVFDPSSLSTSHFDVCIKSSSVNTDNEKRDKHLRNEDFFNVDKYPTICFTSKNIRKEGKQFLTRGTLVLCDVSKEVEIPFSQSGNVLEGSLMIKRLDFNLGSDTGTFTVGDEVALTIKCVLNQ